MKKKLTINLNGGFDALLEELRAKYGLQTKAALVRLAVDNLKAGGLHNADGGVKDLRVAVVESSNRRLAAICSNTVETNQTLVEMTEALLNDHPEMYHYFSNQVTH